VIAEEIYTSQIHIALEGVLLVSLLCIVSLFAAFRAHKTKLRSTQLVTISLVLFGVMCVSVILDSLMQGRFLIYQSAMVLGMGGVVAVRVNRYLRSRRET
jgi:hypothetical protein